MQMNTWRSTIILSFVALLAGCNFSEQTGRVEAQATDCDVALSRCQLEIDGLQVSLTLEKGLAALKPFTITAEIQGGEGIAKVIMDFQMVGMEMGPNRYSLIAVDGAQWRGTATLPVCATSRTEWLAIMEFAHASNTYSLRFPFTTQ